MDIFYYNTPIYREILLKFLQFTEKYYVNNIDVNNSLPLSTVHVVLKPC